MSAVSPLNSVTIANTAGRLAALYWDLADELREAAVALSTVTGPDSPIALVDLAAVHRAAQAGILLRHLAGAGKLP